MNVVVGIRVHCEVQCFFRVITRTFPGNPESWEEFPGNFRKIRVNHPKIFSISIGNSMQKPFVCAKIAIFFRLRRAEIDQNIRKLDSENVGAKKSG